MLPLVCGLLRHEVVGSLGWRQLRLHILNWLQMGPLLRWLGMVEGVVVDMLERVGNGRGVLLVQQLDYMLSILLHHHHLLVLLV